MNNILVKKRRFMRDRRRRKLRIVFTFIFLIALICALWFVVTDKSETTADLIYKNTKENEN